MLAQEGSEGGFHSGREGPSVMSVRRRHRNQALDPRAEQTNLDRFLIDEPAMNEMAGRTHINEREWILTIGTMLRHDLLNKLTVAQGGLELFDRSGEMRFLAMAKRNLNACGEIVGRISTMELDQGSAKLSPIEVGEVAKGVMVGHQEQGIGLEVHGQGWVMADASLHNVLDNLVSNSIKHASPSNIRIDIEDKGRTTLIRVSDDGMGIPLEARGNLFQEGYKFGPRGNTGLGLFIVSRLVQRYGGRIWLDDSLPHGTTFCIELTSMSA
jgi:signal transduction histidine kinase